jgi:hypothetical protein
VLVKNAKFVFDPFDGKVKDVKKEIKKRRISNFRCLMELSSSTFSIANGY